MKKILLIILLLVCNGALAKAQDVYVFPTSDQELQFTRLTNQFRCLVCQNETLSESNALLAKDLRGQIASFVMKGQSDKEIENYLVQRYGQFVLFNPEFNQKTYVLWLGPFMLLLIGSLMLILFIVFSRKQPK